MCRTKFIIIKFKKWFIPFCICLFTIFLLIFSSENYFSARNGLILWANSIVPSLLPFFIATELLGHTNIVYYIGIMFNKLMKPLFNVPGESAFALIMGIISGYPIGAKIVSNLKLQKKLTNNEAERLISFVNNSGPLFIIGTVGIGLFKSKNIGILLFITHLLASINVGLIFRFWKSRNKKRGQKKEYSSLYSQESISLTNLGEVISSSIMSAINTVFLIGGFIVLFSVIIAILERSGFLNLCSNLLIPLLNIFKIPLNNANGIISGIFELTNGIFRITNLSNNTVSLNIVICSFLLGFGGLSVMFQILSIISKAHISIKPYIIGKMLQGILAAFYTYLFFNLFF